MKGNEVCSPVITVVYLGVGSVPVYMLSAFNTLNSSSASGTSQLVICTGEIMDQLEAIDHLEKLLKYLSI